MQVIIITVIGALIAIGAIFQHISVKKRREVMSALAYRLGLHFDERKDRDLVRQLKFLDKLQHGSNRFAFNIFSGMYQKHKIKVFDYHYETGSGEDEDTRYLSFFILYLPSPFPKLTIGPENFLSRIAQALGYDDIDFESHEFSRRFCVRSQDKKFAYDVCNTKMIEYLLANPDLTIEIEFNVLAVVFDRRLEVERIEPNLQRLIRIRSLLPDYLFAQS